MTYLRTIEVSHPGTTFEAFDGSTCYATGGAALADVWKTSDGRTFARLRSDWKCGLCSFGEAWVFDLSGRRRKSARGITADHRAKIEGKAVQSAWLTTEMRDLYEVVQRARRAGEIPTLERDYADDEACAYYLNGTSIQALAADAWLGAGFFGEIEQDAMRFRLRLAGLAA